MAAESFRFDRFVLDPGDRQLAAEGVPVDLNARYFDALALLVGEAGKLVSKDRFLDEVWTGVPVTDEALTQCIKTLRRQLGDDAARPRFIETVPKHGYRFIAPVERYGEAGPVHQRAFDRGDDLRRFFLLGGAGVVGAGVAGIIGGLAYGFAGASQPQPGAGSLSVLLVLLSLTLIAALTGGLGVSFGLAAPRLFGRPLGAWSILGAGVGGLAVGGIVKLLGLDAFNLLLGKAPGDITGGPEGALLGGAVGVGAWLASRAPDNRSIRKRAAIAATAGAVGGMVIALTGGRLMGGSLHLLSRTFPNSRLNLDHLGALFAEPGFGPVTQAATAAIEGGLFAACVVGAMLVARRNLSES